jgi:hypothetical protein
MIVFNFGIGHRFLMDSFSPDRRDWHKLPVLRDKHFGQLILIGCLGETSNMIVVCAEIESNR